MVPFFKNPLVIIPKGDTIEVILDTRLSNSNTYKCFESWPIELLAPQLVRASKKINQQLT